MHRGRYCILFIFPMLQISRGGYVINELYLRLTNIQFWPVVGWVNHQYVPLQFRVIFHSVIACCWYVFLPPILLLFVLWLQCTMFSCICRPLSLIAIIYQGKLGFECAVFVLFLQFCRGIFLNLKAKTTALTKG